MNDNTSPTEVLPSESADAGDIQPSPAAVEPDEHNFLNEEFETVCVFEKRFVLSKRISPAADACCLKFYEAGDVVRDKNLIKEFVDSNAPIKVYVRVA